MRSNLNDGYVAAFLKKALRGNVPGLIALLPAEILCAGGIGNSKAGLSTEFSSLHDKTVSSNRRYTW